MYNVVYSIQENNFSKEKVIIVEKLLNQVYNDFYNRSTKIRVLWNIFPQGNAYTAAKSSNSTLVMASMENRASKENREQFMSVLSQRLIHEINITPEDLVLTVVEKSYFKNYLKFQQRKYRSRIFSSTYIGLNAFSQKLLKGFYNITPIK